MSRKFKIDPLTRIEGHLKIETSVERGEIVDARIGGQMFRGMEKILLGRHPFDAARITQRTCGICHEVHGVASIMAIEELYGIAPPFNGKLLRELILGLHLIGDHIFHFYQLCLPDYIDFSDLKNYSGKDQRISAVVHLLNSRNASIFSDQPSGELLKDKELSIEMALSYFTAVEIRRETASGLAILGGKVPFLHALMPGGLTTRITPGRLRKFYLALQKTADFVEHSYLPQVKQLAKQFPEHFSLGIAKAGFLSYESFSQFASPLFKGGAYQHGKRQPFSPDNTTESIESSFFQADGKPKIDKESAYSWIKTPLYAGSRMEVGPFARLFINQDKNFAALLRTNSQQELHSSVMSRLLARAFETQLLCQHLFALLELYRAGEPTIVPADLDKPVSGSGSGYSIAARGALSHEIEAHNSKVTRYRLLVPSAWNFGPQVNGEKGVVESALIGTQTTESNRSLLAGRIVRSFDPCIACAVH